MRKTKTIPVALFIILLVAEPQLSYVSGGRNDELSAIETQDSSRVYGLVNPASSPKSDSSGKENSTGRYNVTLWVRDWENKTGFGDLNVTIFDLKERMSTSHLTNYTGHVDIRFLYAGSYVVSVQMENRTVAQQIVNVAKNGTHLIRTWSYDLNLTLVDERGKRLANHTVILYDQMVFRSPNYTITDDAVKRRENFTVLTDNYGPLVRKADTNKNGTAQFTNIWNGTYRLGILGKETWIVEYVLGEPVLTLQESAAGDYVLDLQKPANLTLRLVRVDLKLRLISEAGVPIRNATVDIRNMQGHLFYKDYTNKTGFVERKNVYIIDGLYNVSAWCGNRTIGHRVIEVTKTEIFTIEGWAYNLMVRCIDQDRKPLSNYLVFLYDQLVFYSPTNITVVTNQTGSPVNWTKTDKDGIAYFKDVWNGTYWVKVMGSEVVGEVTVNLLRPESITITGNKTYMALRFVTMSGEPLAEATVLVFDDAGDLVFRGRTDENGNIRREGMYLSSYTVNVEWMGTQVWSGTIDIIEDRQKSMKSSVYRLSLRFVDAFGNIVPKADVTLARSISLWEKIPLLDLETDERGGVSLLLPYGSYEVSCSYGIYTGSVLVNLDDDRTLTVTCNIRSILWISMLAVAFPIVVFTLLLERRRLRIPLEIRRYKSILMKLESTYKNGLVEYRIYRKLREEYEAKITELGGREMR